MVNCNPYKCVYMYVYIYIYIKGQYCFAIIVIARLNLFNYVLALFNTKFICNSKFRNLVLRWE